MAFRRSWTLISLGTAFFGVGCGIIASVDRTLIPSDEPTGGAGGVGGAGCTVPQDCPASTEVCTARTCIDAVCGFAPAEEGAVCPDGVCTVEGTCVECIEQAQCGDDEACENNVCVPLQCANGVQDGAETDVDCGGAECTGCAIGQSCTERTDCLSRRCDGGTCAACANDGECGVGDYCDDDGSCALKLKVGVACARVGECASDFCVDGVCCENACGDACETCAEAGFEGNCRPYSAGTDPELECGADTCGGTDACRCDNGVMDGMETGVDCGPAECRACDGQPCNNPSECAGSYCIANLCVTQVCGDTNVDGTETCDDGNTDSFDGCSSDCLLPTDHLLISEVKLDPGAFVEIYNPTNNPVALNQVYLADFTTYYQVTTGGLPPSAGDFSLLFPAGATIAPQSFAVVALSSAAVFNGVHGQNPDFDLDLTDAGAPAMLGTYTDGMAALVGNGQPLVLFAWNGFSSLVDDIDYVIIGSTVNGVDKTGVMVGAGTYSPDTPVGSQSSSPALAAGGGLARCDTAESTETKTMGNGAGNHDETSENIATAFAPTSSPTPGAAPASGFCP